jgi:AraC-like DNA-binding protein
LRPAKASWHRFARITLAIDYHSWQIHIAPIYKYRLIRTRTGIAYCDRIANYKATRVSIVMNTKDAVKNVATGWCRNPALLAEGARTDISTAVWTHDATRVREVSAKPNDGIHSVGIALTAFKNRTSIDNKLIFEGAVRAGYCNIVRAGEAPHGVFEGQWKMLHIYLPQALVQNIADSEDLSAGRAIEIINPKWTHDIALADIGTQLMLEMQNDAPLSGLQIDLLGQSLAIHLLRHHSSLSRAKGLRLSQEQGRLAPWQLKRVQDAIDDQLHEEISLASLAAVAGLSPSYFSRAFKRSMGCSPFEWIAKKRIAKAKHLLAHDNLPIIDIAAATGFSAQAQFTTAFRRMTGLPPGVWRKRHQTK